LEGGRNLYAKEWPRGKRTVGKQMENQKAESESLKKRSDKHRTVHSKISPRT